MKWHLEEAQDPQWRHKTSLFPGGVEVLPQLHVST